MRRYNPSVPLARRLLMLEARLLVQEGQIASLQRSQAALIDIVDDLNTEIEGLPEYAEWMNVKREIAQMALELGKPELTVELGLRPHRGDCLDQDSGPGAASSAPCRPKKTSGRSAGRNPV